MDDEPVISRLISLIHRASEAEMDYLGSLSEGERSAQGTFENWAPKDLIAHTNYWRRRAVESLSYLSRGQNPPAYPEFEQVNRENFEENCGLPLEYQLREAKKIINALDEVLQRFTGQDLLDPNRYPWRKGTPLIAYIISNAYMHPITHLCQTYLKLGDPATASRLQESAVKEIREVEDSLAATSLALYDLACFFAQVGNNDKAIQYLSEVLPFSPSLSEWSRQDPDLAALMDDPRYLALVEH